MVAVCPLKAIEAGHKTGHRIDRKASKVPTITKSPLVLAAEAKQSLEAARRAEDEAMAKSKQFQEALAKAIQDRREASRAVRNHESSDTVRELSEAYAAEAEAKRAREVAHSNYEAARSARWRVDGAEAPLRDELSEVLLADESILDSNASQDLEDAVEAARQACRKQVATSQALSQARQTLKAAKETHLNAEQENIGACSGRYKAIAHLVTVFLETGKVS